MILAQLRERTRPLHDRLEKELDIFTRITTQEAYRRLVQRFWGFYAPLEEALAALPVKEALGLDLDARRKLPALASDLRALGMRDAELARLPRCAAPLPLADAAGALGALYVVEGATLGGQLIARHLKRHFGYDATHGASFFNSYGSAVGAMWRAFGEAAERYCVSAERERRTIAAAGATFERFERWLASAPVALGAEALTARSE